MHVCVVLDVQEMDPSAKFVEGGASRFDVMQGELGDCWCAAALRLIHTRTCASSSPFALEPATVISCDCDSAIDKRQIKDVLLLIRTWARRCAGNYCMVTRIELGMQKFETNRMLLGAIRAESARAKYELAFIDQLVHHNSLLFEVSLTPLNRT